MHTHLYKIQSLRASSGSAVLSQHLLALAGVGEQHHPLPGGYIEDKVLDAGDLDEVNIHRFPRVRTLRVRARDADLASICGCGLQADPGRTANIGGAIACRAEVEACTPTVFTFDPQGFTRVRHGEQVSWAPQRARSCATWSMAEAIRTWSIQASYVPDLDAVMTQLTRRGVSFEEQA
jgi:hypothetical protein